MIRRILSVMFAVVVLLSIVGSTGCIRMVSEAARYSMGAFATNVFSGVVGSALFPNYP